MSEQRDTHILPPSSAKRCWQTARMALLLRDLLPGGADLNGTSGLVSQSE